MKKYIIVAALLVGTFACSESEVDPVSPKIVPTKARTVLDRKSPSPVLKPVEADLSKYINSAAAGTVKAYMATERVIDGAVAHGRVGDYILENEHSRYLIESKDRSMSPCPWGGNVLDASRDGGEDILGEICLFLNAGQTLVPERYDFIEAGPNVGVIAVTGHLDLADYINITGIAGDYLPSGTSLPLDVDNILPFTVTVYYILHGDSNVMRMVTAMRNDGDEMRDVVVAHLMVAGGDGRFFNPLSTIGGFGATNGQLVSEKWPFIGFVGLNSSYFFGPITEDIELTETAPIPSGGAYITISGVAAVATGVRDIIQALTVKPAGRSSVPGIIQLEPGDTATLGHYFVSGDRSVSSSLDELYPILNVPTQIISGVVKDADGNVVEGARITAARGITRGNEVNESTMSQTFSDADGTFSMKVPHGDYRMLARKGAAVSVVTPELSLRDADVSDVSISLDIPAKLILKVKTPDQVPTPARVTIICADGCATRPSALEADIAATRLPRDWAAVEWLGMDGSEEIELSPGRYFVVVSRGFEWSTWPSDAVSSGGYEFTLAAGDELLLEAEIAQVMDTSGALSGDFHIHSLPSPDSTVPLITRTLNYLAEGVDVMVSTDHDIISDFEPEIIALGAQSQITSMVGAEITTSDTGHHNAFPLQRDDSHRRGGALDWGQGAGPGMDPSEVFEWAHSHPGEQVVQINHPGSMGLINTTQADVLRGITYADRSFHRLAERESDPVTGDTKLWSEDFTAMEVMTGNSVSRFWGISRWWLTMMGRGFVPTGTAVSDTHKRYSDLGGSPRTYVFVPEGADSALTFDPDSFVRAVNEGRAIGTSGPFVRVSASNNSGDTIGLGDTIPNDGEPITVRVEIQTPEWFTVNKLRVLSNLDLEDLITQPGKTTEEGLTPTQSIDLPAMQLVDVVTGSQVHRRHELTYEFEVDASEDAYVVLLFSGDETMDILVPGNRPFAFTNPFFIDADGAGYNHPPYAEAAASLPVEARRLPLHGHDHDHDHEHQALTKELIHKMYEGGTCHH